MSKINNKKWQIISLMLLAFSMSASVSARPGQPDYHYAGDLQIDEQGGHIRADWQITVFDESETDITFFLRDSLDMPEVSGPGVEKVSTEKQSGSGDFWVIEVTLAESSGEEAQRQRLIRIAYAGVLLPEPMENRINAIESGRVELTVDSFWFPIDARFSKVLTADLAVHIGEGWQGVTTGDAIAIDDGFRILNTDPRMDIAFSLSKSFHITREEGFTIYDQRAQHSGTQQLVETASQCRHFLNSRFGDDDPLPVAKLLITERASSGYSRENYIAFTDISETKQAPLTRFVCHEFAHYWSQGAKFDTVDNWINESFAEYLGLMAVREYLGQAAYDEMLASFAQRIADLDLPRIWKQGDTERGPELVQYRKAPLVLARLENAMGQAEFIGFIRAFFSSTDKTTPALLKVLDAVAGPEKAALFESMLAE